MSKLSEMSVDALVHVVRSSNVGGAFHVRSIPAFGLIFRLREIPHVYVIDMEKTVDMNEEQRNLYFHSELERAKDKTVVSVDVRELPRPDWWMKQAVSLCAIEESERA